jgi:hypothetical protein
MTTARIATLTAAALLAGAAPATADTGLGKATGFDARFTTAHRGAPSGLSLRVTGAPPAAGVQLAPTVRQVVTLPRGTRLDLRALPQCSEALAAEGACPASTRIGTGVAEGVSAGRTLRFALEVHPVGGELVFASGPQSFRATASGRRLTFLVPTLGGALAPTLFEAKLHRGEHLFTPRRCPAGGRWAFGAAFRGLDAAGAPVGAGQSLGDSSRCE